MLTFVFVICLWGLVDHMLCRMVGTGSVHVLWLGKCTSNSLLIVIIELNCTEWWLCSHFGTSLWSFLFGNWEKLQMPEINMCYWWLKIRLLFFWLGSQLDQLSVSTSKYCILLTHLDQANRVFLDVITRKATLRRWRHVTCFQDINTPLQLQSDHVEQSTIFNGEKGGIKDRTEESRGCYGQKVKSISSLCFL